MRILVTGGAGYIGGHTVVALLRAGHDEIAMADASVAGRSPAASNRPCAR